MEGTLPGLLVAAQFSVNQRKRVAVRESDASWQALRCVSHTLQEEGSPCEWPHQAFCVPQWERTLGTLLCWMWQQDTSNLLVFMSPSYCFMDHGMWFLSQDKSKTL